MFWWYVITWITDYDSEEITSKGIVFGENAAEVTDRLEVGYDFAEVISIYVKHIKDTTDCVWEIE